MKSLMPTARTMSLLLLIAALSLALVACGDDGVSDELSEALEEAGFDESDFDEDELAEAEETLAEMDQDDRHQLPDDFPAGIPLPDDVEVADNQSSDFDDGRRIWVTAVSDESVDEWVARYQAELPGSFEILEETIVETEEDGWDLVADQLYPHILGHWRIAGQGWEYGTVTVADGQAWYDDLMEDAEHFTDFQLETFETYFGDATVIINVIARDYLEYDNELDQYRTD